MKKVLKKAFAIFLSIVMTVGIAPVSGFAELIVNAADSELVTNTGNKITRAEWLHNLSVIFDMTVEDELYPDNYYSDLEETHKYYYDILLNTNFGVIDIAAGGELKPDAVLTRDFAAHTLNFCLGYQLESEKYTFSDSVSCKYPADAQVAVNRGWFALSSGKFSPDKTVTDAEVKAMVKDAEEVLESRIVDENYDSEYTFHSSVIEIPDGTEVSVEENVLNITDCKKNITVGSKFAVYHGGIPKIYEATAVTKSGDDTVVTFNPDFDGSSLLLDADAQGVTDATEFVITPAEDATITVVETAQTASTYNMRDIKKFDKSIEVKKSISLGSGAKVDCKVVIKNPKLEYIFDMKSNRVKLVFDGDADVSFGGSFDLTKAMGIDKINLGSVGIPGIASIGLYANLTVGGSLTIKTKCDVAFGFDASGKDGFSIVKNFHTKEPTLVSTATCTAGVTVQLDANAFGIAKANAYFKVGGTAGIEEITHEDGKTPVVCTTFSAFIYANYGASVDFIIGKDYNTSGTIWDVKNSPVKIVRHYEDRTEVCTCSRGQSLDYFTTWNSIYGGSGWLEGFGSKGYNRNKEPIIIYEYTLNDRKEATITKYQGNATALYIPEKLDGYTVIKLGANSFENNKYLRYVSVPDSVTEFDSYVFKNCTNLYSVDLSQNLTKVEKEDFRNTALYEIDIPDSVTFIGAAAFADCKNLSNVKLSKSLETMVAYSFGYCENLREIEIPKSLVSTESAYYYEYNYGYYHGPFMGSDNLKTVSFEEGTTKIVNGLLANMKGLEKIEIPDSVLIIEDGAFWDTINLKEVKFSDNLTTIENSAFRNTALTDAIIPDTVTSIGSAAFAECKELNNVKLSNSLDTMGVFAFGYCDKLTDIKIPKSLDSTSNGYYPEFVRYYCYGPFAGSKNLKNVTFEEGIVEISNGLFANSYIESVKIPDTVTRIESDAFNDSILLSDVDFSKSLTIIEHKAFRNTALTEVKIPDSVTKIDSGAFVECKELSDVKLPKYLNSMGAYAFACCDSLTEIEIPKSLKTTTDAYFQEYALNGYHFGVFFNSLNLKKVTFEEGMQTIPQGLFANNSGIEKIEIPETVTCIEQKAFLNCANLKDVVLHDGLTEIAFEAFYNSGITSISIPDTVTTLGNAVFAGCTSLKQVKLSQNITSVKQYSFENCSALEKIIISELVETIGSYAFKNCTSLKEITLGDSLKTIDRYAFENCDALTEIEIPDSVTTIGEGTFYDCDGIAGISIPDSVTDLGAKAFMDNDLLSDVTLGTGITKLKASTFEHCDVLKEIKLPYRVTTIESKAFKDCVKFTDITIPRLTTSIATDAFSYLNNLTITGVSGTYAETYAKENNIKFVAKDVNATAVTIDKKTVEINKGQSTKLYMTVTPSDFTDKVSWKSSDESIVTIAEDGTLTAKNVGTATIKLVVGSKSASCKVTVLQPVTRIRLNSGNVSLDGGKTYQLNATVEPGTAANKEIEWVSSDESVATVTQDGFVTAYKKGKATITVKAKDGSGVTANCTVNVISNAFKVTGVKDFESPHNYEDNCTDLWIYTCSGTESVGITFDDRTNIEDGFDYLYIYDKDDKEIGKYTGTELAGQTITVTGDTVKIKIVSDDSGNEWGFRVSRIDVDHEHSYSSKVTQQANCTQKGITTFTCECGDEYTEETSASGHTVGGWITESEVSCTEDGRKVKKCTVCEEVIEIETTPAKGHVNGEAVIENITEGNCTENGSYEEVVYCTVCKAEISREKNVSEATGHTPSEPVEENRKEATCTENGSYEEYVYCSVCSELLSVETVVIHATGHLWSEWSVVEEPTMTTDGRKVRVCNACSYVETDTIPKTGITVTLLDSKGNVVKEKIISGNATTVFFSDIANGNYTLTVSKATYETRAYNISVTSGVINTIFTLNKIGDITGDGKVNTVDVARANSHAKKVSLLSDYALACADVTGDGKVNTIDVARINSHAKGVSLLW